MMKLIEVKAENAPQAEKYLKGIGLLESFKRRRIPGTIEWMAIIQFANRHIEDENQRYQDKADKII
jgi:hypothetical protein